MAVLDWILSLGTSGATENAAVACDRRRAEEARVDALVAKLDTQPAKQPAA